MSVLKTTTSRYNISSGSSSHQNQARSPAFHRIRSSAFHRISHRSHAFHRISHQPGWLTSCNTGLKVISAQRNSPAHIIRPSVCLLSYLCWLFILSYYIYIHCYIFSRLYLVTFHEFLAHPTDFFFTMYGLFLAPFLNNFFRTV